MSAMISSLSLLVNVNSIGGSLGTIAISSSWTGLDVKHAIQSAFNIPESCMCLLVGTKRLYDGDLLSDTFFGESGAGGVNELTLLKRSEEYAEWAKKLRNSTHYSVYRDAPDHIKQDKDMVLEAIAAEPRVFHHISAEFQACPDVILAAVKTDAWIFRDLQEQFRGHKQIVLTAVQQDGRLLEFASPKIRRDREVILAAVQNYSRALYHVPIDCWDHDIVMAALLSGRRDGMLDSCLLEESAIKGLFGDRNFMLRLLQQDGSALKFASTALQADRELVTAAVERHGGSLQHACVKLQADRDIVMKAIKQDPSALQFAARSLRADRAIVLEAVRRDGRALAFAWHQLYYDVELYALSGMQ